MTRAHLAALLQQCQRAPNDPEAFYELGRAYLAQLQADAAEQAFQQALRLAPGHPQILMQLGNVASMQGREAQAAEFFTQSLAQDPQQADVHFNLANSLRKLGQTARAISHYITALRLAPHDAECHNNLGNAYREQGQLAQAVACYAQALTLQPGLMHAKVHWIHQKQHMADWQGLPAAIAEVQTALRTQPQAQIPPFAFLAMPGTQADEQLACASRWAQQHYGHITPLPPPAPRPEPSARRIRLAYLSADFRRHPLAYLVTDVIAAHDRQQFEVWLFSQAAPEDSPEQAAFKAAADHWVEIAQQPDAAVAQHMRAAEVDVLIDLTGYTQQSRSGVVAYRPARVHINWLGYPGSMGRLSQRPLYDVILLDETLSSVPVAEQVVCLPCYQPNNAQRPLGEAGSRAQHGLPAQGMVFACFNQSFKITPEVFARWLRLLQQVPGSVLWLLQSNTWATQALKTAATAAGVASDRLVFAPRTDIAQHIARQQHADLMLDTTPYNAHTTASDALWQGVPLLTVIGDTFPARVSASLLKQVGLEACICEDWDALEALALALAQDRPRLDALKQQLRAQAKLLFDPQDFCQHLEHAYQQCLNTLV